MRFLLHLEKDLLSLREYAEERTEVRSLTGIKKVVIVRSGSHVPMTALQSSSMRSNLCESQHENGGPVIQYGTLGLGS